MNKIDVLGVLNAICIVIILWAVVSYAEVISKNCSPNPQYHDLNLVSIVCNAVE